MYAYEYPKIHLKILWPTDWIKSAMEMSAEHYTDCNIYLNEYQNYIIDGNKQVYYNLEHRHPIDNTGCVKWCHPYYENSIIDFCNIVDELWDFQIENYRYYQYYKLTDKFRFKPFRYTSWFEQYRKKENPDFDIQFECVFDTNIRRNILWLLTADLADPTTRQISINLTNTSDINIKYSAKNKCRYGIDVPHYDTPCTYNNFRIFEYICMNKPVIVIDPYDITSKKYFDELCTYTKWPSPKEIVCILDTPPRSDIADTFKQMTYSDKDYDNYRYLIIKDHYDRTGEMIPDSAMY